MNLNGNFEKLDVAVKMFKPSKNARRLSKEEKIQYRRKNLGQIFAQNLNTSIGAERDERDTKSILDDINKIFPGLVHIAAQKLGNAPLHEKHQFGNIGRGKVREASIIAALNLLKKVI